MSLDFGFEPNPERASALDRRMHEELGSSLRYLSQEVARLISDPPDLTDLIQRLNSGVRHRPGTFGRYYALGLAAENDDHASSARLMRELAKAQPAASGLEVLALSDVRLAEDAVLYRELMSGDADLDIGFEPPTAEVASAFAKRLAAGLELLDQTLPLLAGEIRALLRHIVIAQGDPSKPMQFDGGSHFQLWGALFLNGHFHPDALSIAEVLAHECGHCLLFGFSIDEALVENSDDERYASPLRPDPRPMDGIFHAVFVSARMHWAMHRLSVAPNLSRDEQGRAALAAASDLENFKSGLSIIQRHGRLTTTGDKLLQGACRYIEECAA